MSRSQTPSDEAAFGVALIVGSVAWINGVPWVAAILIALGAGSIVSGFFRGLGK